MKTLRVFPLLALLLLIGCGKPAQRHEHYPMRTHVATVFPKQDDRPLIYLDPGHGGHDPGARSADEAFEEKNLALATTLMTRNHLQSLGYRVRVTRRKDIFIPLTDRSAQANEAHATIFVSIHYNAATTKEPRGIEVYTFRSEHKGARERDSHELASLVLDQLIAETHAPSRGLKEANFSVLRRTTMPAILVEGGFMSNPDDMRKLENPRYLNTIADAIARGIDKYLKEHSSP